MGTGLGASQSEAKNGYFTREGIVSPLAAHGMKNGQITVRW